MRFPRLPQAAAAAVILVLVFASGALAGSGQNGIFNLGVINDVDGFITKLTGSTLGPLLYVVNSSTESASRALRVDSAGTPGTIFALNSGGGPAADFVVNEGKRPFTVNSEVKVNKLNADLLDGNDSSAFLPVGSKAADAKLLDGKDSSAFLPVDGKAADASNLDGLDSTAFLRGSTTTLVFGDNTYWHRIQINVSGGADNTYGVYAGCNPGGDVWYQVYNDTPNLIRYLVDSGGDSPSYKTLAGGETTGVINLVDAGDHVEYALSGTGSGAKTGTLDLWARDIGSQCWYVATRTLMP